MNNPDVLEQQKTEPGVACSAWLADAELRWRQLTSPWWRKHRNAERNMMRWMWRADVTRRGNKYSRRLRKWMREYERTIMRMPNPPDGESANS